MPLAFPSVGIQHIDLRLNRTVAVAESPFTYDQQVHDFGGARWEAEITLPPLSDAQARSVEAFIIGLKGRSGTFTMGHPLHNSTANSTVTSAAIRAESFTTTAGSGAVTAGTYFQIGDYLYVATADKASGANTLSFQPPLRAAIGTSTALDFTLPKSLWRLASNDVGWSTDAASMHGFAFACVEAL
jgi:hypothetical protein